MSTTALAAEPKDWVEISDPAQLPEKPTISVLMLAYNHGPYLAEAIEGVISQITDFPVELLIGDDCSRDNTLQVALDYQKKYPGLIRVLYSCPNVGVAGNLKRLIQESRGEYSAFCEGDDYWIDREKLSLQVNMLRSDDAIAIVHADHIVRYDFWGRRFLLQTRGRYADLADKACLVGDLSEKCFGGLLTHTSTVVCKTKHLKEYLATQLVTSAGFAYDCCIVNYCALQGTAAYVDRAVSAYRITPGSLTRSGVRGAQKLALEIRDFFVLFCDTYGKYAVRREKIYKDYTLGILKTSFRLGDEVNFRKAAQDMKKLNLDSRERFTVRWHEMLFDLPWARWLVAQAASLIQKARQIRHQLMIYTGVVDRIVLRRHGEG